MKKSRPLFWTVLFIFLFSLFLLVSGSDLLLLKIVENPTLPLGSITTALGLVSLPVLIAYTVHSQSNGQSWKLVLNITLFVSFLLSIFWLPLGRFLSGNWSNSFVYRPKESSFFWNYTYLTVGLPIGILILHTLLRMWKSMVKK